MQIEHTALCLSGLKLRLEVSCLKLYIAFTVQQNGSGCVKSLLQHVSCCYVTVSEIEIHMLSACAPIGAQKM